MIIGIDPGLTGAVAYLNGDTLKVWDIPTQIASKTRKRNKKGEMVDVIRKEIDDYALANLIDRLPDCPVYLEKVQSMSKQGVTSMFNFGVSFGMIRGVLAALEYKPVLVSPQKWKKALKTTADKEHTCGRACQIFPEYTDLWFGPGGGMLDGRFEAALIAYYGRMMQTHR